MKIISKRAGFRRRMLATVALLALTACCSLAIQLDYAHLNDSLSVRELFYQDFEQKCARHPFLQRFQQLMTEPRDRFVIFVYHKPGLRNGGFGDRLGGLVTAMAYAVKYNRTLIIQASNGMDDLFKPYHPLDRDKPDAEQAYTWKNWKSWSQYNLTRLTSKYGRDLLRYSLDDCVSNQEGGFSVQHTYKCAMMEGDVPHRIVRLASNRAYLCMWNNPKIRNTRGKHYPAYRDTLQAMGLSRTSDLFQLAGCLLRLALWPRDALWDAVDAAYREMTADLVHSPPRLLSSSSSSSSSASTSRIKLTTPRRSLLLKTATAMASTSFTRHVPRAYQVGLHFRCGDYHSYRQLRLHTDGYDRHACVFDVVADADVVDFAARGKSRNLNAGHPYSIGTCAAYLLSQYQAAWATEAESTRQQIDQTTSSSRIAIVNMLGEAEDEGLASPPPRRQAPAIVLFASSDNLSAGQQMKETSGHEWTLLAPQGCHIDLDDSTDCYLHTTVYWFLLALSDRIVTQTFGEFNAPASAFSRFAGMYGLRNDWPIHTGRYCGEEETSLARLSRFHQGNWFCENQ